MTKTSIKLKFRESTIPNHDGTLYFQIIHERKVCQFTTNYHIHDYEWNKKKSMITNGNDSSRNQVLANIRESISNDLRRLNLVLVEFERKGFPFTSDDVIAKYRREISENTLFKFMEGVISQLKQRGKIRTSEAYREALNSYRKFRDGRDIMLDDITSDEILLYEAYMANRGLCPNTTSFYMRNLRATYNLAVEKGIIVQKYPFKHVYTGVGKTAKRAINLEDIKRIKLLDLKLKPSLALARDIFLFSFYTRGMAYVDMVYLRKKDIQCGIIKYRRHKTGQQLTIKVEKCAQEIINRYITPDSDYIFPIIKANGDEYKQYKNALRLINGKLKKIGMMIGTPIKITTYVSRHSWGSAAKANNIPISVISESLGHDNETTTQIYLASLDTSVIDQANSKILRML